MPLSRVEQLLNAYFNEPMKEYLRVLSEIKASGGLTSEEVNKIETRVLYVDASTIVRQTSEPHVINFTRLPGE